MDVPIHALLAAGVVALKGSLGTLLAAVVSRWMQRVRVYRGGGMP